MKLRSNASAIFPITTRSRKQINISFLYFLSLRQYERKFIERMGISPRYFNKIVRFENAFRMKNKHPHLDWLTIAIHCGYYDYQHLVKDYKKFTTQTPTEFHLLDSSSPERKFGESDTY
jgi:transcriptional regulator GlxA family with amidase domain